MVGELVDGVGDGVDDLLGEQLPRDALAEHVLGAFRSELMALGDVGLGESVGLEEDGVAGVEGDGLEDELGIFHGADGLIGLAVEHLDFVA